MLWRSRCVKSRKDSTGAARRKSVTPLFFTVTWRYLRCTSGSGSTSRRVCHGAPELQGVAHAPPPVPPSAFRTFSRGRGPSDASPARAPVRTPPGPFHRARGPFLTAGHHGTPRPTGSGPRRKTRCPERQHPHPHERRNPHS
ncbi:hypothetical protein EZV63_31175 [Streptomyces sp. VN1]|nr:hypothetical protein EZV63_31175 [Streptomyces sp. VN1]